MSRVVSAGGCLLLLCSVVLCQFSCAAKPYFFQKKIPYGRTTHPYSSKDEFSKHYRFLWTKHRKSFVLWLFDWLIPPADCCTYSVLLILYDSGKHRQSAVSFIRDVDIVIVHLPLEIAPEG